MKVKLKNTIKLFLKPFVINPNNTENGFAYWRYKIVCYINASLIYLGFFALILGVFAAIKDKLYSVAVLDIIVYLILLVILLSKKIPFKVKSLILLTCIYLLGLFITINIGPYGAGLMWLFAFPIFTAIFLGKKASYNALIINFITLVVISFLLANDKLQPFLICDYSINAWLVSSINFILINLATTLAIALLLFRKKKNNQH